LLLGLKKLKKDLTLSKLLGKKNKILLNAVIYLKGLEIIIKTIKIKLFKKIEISRFLFWENKVFFSKFKLRKNLGKQDVFFFEIYNFLMNLYEWGNGIRFLNDSDFHIKATTRYFEKQQIFLKNTKRIFSKNVHFIYKKNSLEYDIVPDINL
jgi:hypothetical protein